MPTENYLDPEMQNSLYHRCLCLIELQIFRKSTKGKFNKGLIEAELDIKEKMWFFDCHFKEDPVMPGCLGLDAMWQLVGFFLGWIGQPGKGRALGVNSVKFTGEVLKNVKIARYQVDMKRILKKKELP